jgi:L-rhamnose isomerase
MADAKIERAYEEARETFARLDVDTEAALQDLAAVSLSVHCWQGDDVGGFESPEAILSGGGLQVTGSYPGRARTVGELRQDLRQAYSLLPGRHRLNLHAIYGEFGGRTVDRDEVDPEHFQGWAQWAEEQGLKVDFNCTCFSHPRADSGFTLSHRDRGVRSFWLEHVKRCRAIGAYFGRRQGSPCYHNIWIPDGSKEIPLDRWLHRGLLLASLDELFATPYSADELRDSLESKLFGIGSESYVVGSHEFYFGYAQSRQKILCLDLGHFHPTESVADKVSAILQFFPELALHLSRGVRWDSDHVVLMNEDVTALAAEIVRNGLLDRVHFGLDFFDASLNRVGAWVIGGRAVLKAVLLSLLEPVRRLRDFESRGRTFEKLAWLEELKGLPYGAVWDYHCLRHGVPPGLDWVGEIESYEREVLDRRESGS